MNNDAGILIWVLLLALLVGVPLLSVGLGLWKLKTCRSTSGQVLLGSGIAVLCAYLFVVLGYIAIVAPGRSGIVAKGISPEGREYCVVQTFKHMRSRTRSVFISATRLVFGAGITWTMKLWPGARPTSNSKMEPPM